MATPQERVESFELDKQQYTPQDLEFIAFVQRKALVNIFGGITIGAALPYLAIRNRGGSLLLRSSAVVAGALGGLMAGSIATSYQATERVATLDNNSYIKKIANEVLIDRYPMAVADTMDHRRQGAAKPQK